MSLRILKQKVGSCEKREHLGIGRKGVKDYAEANKTHTRLTGGV